MNYNVRIVILGSILINCLRFIKQEIDPFETHEIPLCTLEWDENDQNGASDRYSNIRVEIDSHPIIETLNASGLSFAHININGIHVKCHIDELRFFLKHKPYYVIGINVTKLTKDRPTSKFANDGFDMFRANRKKQFLKRPCSALCIKKGETFEEKQKLYRSHLCTLFNREIEDLYIA